MLWLLGYLALLEVAIALAFRRSGHLDEYVARYADAVRVSEAEAASAPHERRQGM